MTETDYLIFIKCADPGQLYKLLLWVKLFGNLNRQFIGSKQFADGQKKINTVLHFRPNQTLLKFLFFIPQNS
jgi:hypothetical protein